MSIASSKPMDKARVQQMSQKLQEYVPKNPSYKLSALK
jgi:hypothetical protein